MIWLVLSIEILLLAILVVFVPIHCSRCSILYTNNNITNIKRYTVFGERSSGTKYLGNTNTTTTTTSSTLHQQHCNNNYNNFYSNITYYYIITEALISNNFNVSLTWDYGYKHFYGYNEYHHNASSPARMPKGYYYHKLNNNSNDVLFIGIIRHPLQWLAAFKSKPDHVCRNNTINWSSFLFNEWMSTYDYSTHKDDNYYNKEIMSDRHIYTGQRYHNIFELRRVKAKYLLDDITNKVHHYYFVRFEDVQSRPIDIVNDIARIFRIPIINNDNVSTSFEYYSAIKKRVNDEYVLDKDIEKIASANLDLEIEKRCNYYIT